MLLEGLRIVFIFAVMYRNWSYSLSLLPGIAAVFGNLAGGIWSASNLVFSLVLLGGFEMVAGENTSNRNAPNRIFPELVLFAHVALHLLVLASLFWGIEHGTLQHFSLAAAVLSSGVAGGSGAIIIAHELIHKVHPVKRFFGQMLLLSCGNYYFYIHHLRVHHRFVGEDRDAATAKRGENLYVFFRRTVAGQSKEAWQSETSLLRGKRKNTLGLQNTMVRNIIILIALLAAVGLAFGLTAVFAWLGVCVVANFLLEYVNYIEHYGLTRKAGQKVTPMHSWNSDKRVSRFFLIDLSRHADHHTNPSKDYYILDTFDEAPTLPGGYASLILPALIPSWWFALMHPRLDRIENSG